MLGYEISDPDMVEEGGKIRGMELLPLVTVLQKEKIRCQVEGKIDKLSGSLAGISGCNYRGYEIHMGKTSYIKDRCYMKNRPHMKGALPIEDTQNVKKASNVKDTSDTKVISIEEISDIVVSDDENVYGSYVHGLFDAGEIANTIVQTLAQKKGIHIEDATFEDYQAFKETQYDKLADTLRMYMDMEEVYGMLQEASLE